MAKDTKIEWADHTFNPWRGCTKVSDGCKNCYADTLSKRNPRTLGVWGANGTRIVAADAYWRQPIDWNEEARADGVRHRVFCASLADVFEADDTMPAPYRLDVAIARQRLAAVIRDTPHLDWLLLTKRPENIVKVAEAIYPAAKIDILSLPNIWLGTSVENQEAAEQRIPQLLEVPFNGVRFLSMEPLLEDVNIMTVLIGHKLSMPAPMGYRPQDFRLPQTIDWVIVGGESGHNARPVHPDWVRSLRDQCQSNHSGRIPFFFKQIGEYAWQVPGEPWSEPDIWLNKATARTTRSEDEAIADGGSWKGFWKVGKRVAGRQIDGREWSELPNGR